MKILMAPSDAARQIMDALNLPKNTVAVTFRMRANEAATLEVETLVQLDGAEELVSVLKRYRLHEKPEETGRIEFDGWSP